MLPCRACPAKVPVRQGIFASAPQVSWQRRRNLKEECPENESGAPRHAGGDAHAEMRGQVMQARMFIRVYAGSERFLSRVASNGPIASQPSRCRWVSTQCVCGSVVSSVHPGEGVDRTGGAARMCPARVLRILLSPMGGHRAFPIRRRCHPPPPCPPLPPWANRGEMGRGSHHDSSLLLRSRRAVRKVLADARWKYLSSIPPPVVLRSLALLCDQSPTATND